MNLTRLPTTISNDERRFLERLARGRKCPQKIVLHAKIVLRFADGMRKAAIAKELSTSRPTVDLWLSRFAEFGCDGFIRDAPRPGGRKPLPSDRKSSVLWVI